MKSLPSVSESLAVFASSLPSSSTLSRVITARPSPEASVFFKSSIIVASPVRSTGKSRVYSPGRGRHYRIVQEDGQRRDAPREATKSAKGSDKAQLLAYLWPAPSFSLSFSFPLSHAPFAALRETSLPSSPGNAA